MNPERKAFIVVALIVGGLAIIYSGQRFRINKTFVVEHPLTVMAEKISAGAHRDWCDQQVGKQREYVTAVLDRFRPQIQALWQNREQKPGQEVPTVSIGKISLRLSEAEKKNPELLSALEFDDSSWSWEEAYGLIRKTQADFLDQNQLRLNWRDADSITAYLLEKDYARTQLGRKFLPPDLTEHQFRINPGVSRSGKKEFTVLLDAGEFAGYEKVLAGILEKEWRAKSGVSMKVSWVRNNPAAYRFEANLVSGRSYVNHSRRAIVVENLAWTKTLAHELGHVLGFDDHYYSVWNPEHCYYTQMARNADLMSNSQRGEVLSRHWELLDQAYPLDSGAKKSVSFTYVFKRRAGK